MKPSMQVYEQKGRSLILCGSGNPYDDDFAYMPCFGKDGNNHLT